jgi:hypothetical protein
MEDIGGKLAFHPDQLSCYVFCALSIDDKPELAARPLIRFITVLGMRASFYFF